MPSPRISSAPAPDGTVSAQSSPPPGVNQSPQPSAPKQTTGRADPPPAYAPLSRSHQERENLRASILAAFGQHALTRINNASRQAQRPLAMPPAPAPLFERGEAEEDFPEYATDAQPSPINIRVSTAVHVNNSHNIVCLDATPAELANSIAGAVVTALRDNTGGMIPMIDENGCPRPLAIEIDAGVVVGGTNCVLGRESVLEKYFKHREAVDGKRKRESDDEDGSGRAKRMNRTNRPLATSTEA